MKLFRIALLFSLVVLTGCSSFGILSQSPTKLSQKYADETSKYINIEGMNIHYRDQGQGPVLILLHGVASSLHTWDAWSEELGDSYRVIRLDIPGHGLTGPAPKGTGYNIESMLTMLDTFMQRLKIEKAHFAGNSLGGYISWKYAVAHPEKVDKLILLDSAGFPQKMPFIMNVPTYPGMGLAMQIFMPRFIVSQNIKRAYGDKKKIDKKLVKRYHDLQMRKGNRGALVKLFREMKAQSRQANLGDDVVKVKAPTLLMWGEEDRWVPIAVMEQFRERLANVSVVTYEGVGHMPMEELPVQSARDARHFLENGEPYLLPSTFEKQ